MDDTQSSATPFLSATLALLVAIATCATEPTEPPNSCMADQCDDGTCLVVCTDGVEFYVPESDNTHESQPYVEFSAPEEKPIAWWQARGFLGE